MHVIKILMMMYDTTRQYLNFKQTGVWYSSSFSITRPSNLGCSTFDKQILPLTRSRRAVPYWAYFWCRNYRGACDLCLTDRDTSIFSATETSQLLPRAKHCRHCVQQFLLARPVSLKFRRKPCQQLKYSKDFCSCCLIYLSLFDHCGHFCFKGKQQKPVIVWLHVQDVEKTDSIWRMLWLFGITRKLCYRKDGRAMRAI